jgi:predicted CoA-binding protein
MPLLDDDTSVERLLRSARSIAVVGLSDKPHRESYAIARYLLDQGYTMYPVNPTIRSVFGLLAYKNLQSIGAPIDIVDVFRRPELVLPVVEDAIAAGMQTLWFQLGVADPAATELALARGLQVIEERCIMVEHRHLVA